MLNVEILRVHPALSAGMYPGSWSWCHPDMWKQRAFWHSLTMQWLISQCDGSCKDNKTKQNKRGIHKLHRKTGRQICTANNLEKVAFPAGRPRQNLMVPLTLLAKRHPISRTGNFCASSPCSSPQPSRPKLASPLKKLMSTLISAFKNTAELPRTSRTMSLEHEKHQWAEHWRLWGSGLVLNWDQDGTESVDWLHT